MSNAAEAHDKKNTLSESTVSMGNSIATKLLRMVFYFYLAIAVGVTLAHMVMEYRYQKKNINQDLENIRKTFEQVLAIEIWRLDHKALESTVKGMLKISVIRGVKIENENGEAIGMGGIISQEGQVGNVGLHVNLLGLDKQETAIHKDQIYQLEIFKRQFPITYAFQGKTKKLGQATLYSNANVILRRVKLGFLLLIINAIVKTAMLWFIFLWISNSLLRKPLASLATAAKNVNLENLDACKVNIKTSGRNELKVLEESFNLMIDNLRLSIAKQKRVEEELSKYRNHLEELVEERAKELHKINEELQSEIFTRKEMEGQLIQAERLAAVGELAGGMSHELRNPLGIIGNSIYYLNMRLGEKDEKVKKHLDILNREVKRTTGIVMDLLEFSEVKSYAFVEGSLNALVKEALSSSSIPDNIIVKTQLDETLPLCQLATERILLVFRNLVSNAVHSMSTGGKLEAASKIKDEMIEIMFRDTGGGIKKEDIPKVFEPLYTTKTKGIGLGLAISKNIIEEHKGEIEVVSKLSKGATFTVTIPVQREK